MTVNKRPLSRRTFLATAAAAGAAVGLGVSGSSAAATSPGPRLTRPIPKSGERIPAVGMGSWLTFDVGDDADERARRVSVLENFFAAGGGMIDSSPMYGTSEEVIGHGLKRIKDSATLFSATKIWTPVQWHGRQQMDLSEKYWGLERFDLNQIHNLLNWESHIETLDEAKRTGRIRYIGVTTSHGRRHRDLADVMAAEPIDFVQLTYNIFDREAEARLLPLAADRGLAVIVNRPFQGGWLFNENASKPLPGWAGELGCANWAQVFLKFAISHPAVTCAIPATSNPDHMVENMGAGLGPMPDAAMRRRMAADVTGV